MTVTNDLRADSDGSSGFDVADLVLAEIAEKFARTEHGARLAGDGSNKPKGFLDDADADGSTWTFPATPAIWALRGLKTGVKGDFAAAPKGADKLIDLGARSETGFLGGGVWMMNTTTQAEIRKRTDSNGAGQPAILPGCPMVPGDDMPAVLAGSLSVAFGDFSTCTIAQREGMCPGRLSVRRASWP